MARDNDTRGQGQAEPPDMKAMLIDALKSLSPSELQQILTQSGAAPTTIGMTTESMQMLLGSLSATNAETMKQALRSQRKENPNYPEQSVFHPAGRFSDDGTALPDKVKLRRRTYHNGVLLGGELETEEEINLCNQFTEDKTARNGLWTATILEKGTSRERINIKTPSQTPDERMENSLPLPLILRELLGGADAVNPATLSARMAKLEAKLAELGETVPV